MPRVAPFRGLTFDPALVGSLDLVTAPPYDVIDEEARRRFMAASPYNVVHLDLGEAGGDETKYRRAAGLLRSWRSNGVLRSDVEPSFYAYEMRFRLDDRDRRLRGVLCALELEDWGDGVMPHERTLSGPIEDRLRLLRETKANLSAVYGIIEGPSIRLSDALEATCSVDPRWEASDEEGVQHRMWELPAAADVPAWLASERLLIADGHHRYSTALRFRNEMRAEAGPGPWDRVLALVVDAAIERPSVLPFHRIVTMGEPPARGRQVRDLGELLAELDDDRLVYGTASMGGSGSIGVVHRVAELEGEPPTVRALHDQVLATDLRAGVDVKFTPDPVAAEREVSKRAAVAAYFLPPTSTVRIHEAIGRGERLPPKSTFFWPKPRTGMVMRPLE